MIYKNHYSYFVFFITSTELLSISLLLGVIFVLRVAGCEHGTPSALHRSHLDHCNFVCRRHNPNRWPPFNTESMTTTHAKYVLGVKNKPCAVASNQGDGSDVSTAWPRASVTTFVEHNCGNTQNFNLNEQKYKFYYDNHE